MTESRELERVEFELILKSLTDRPMMTVEVETVLESRGFRCPDELARALAIMRQKGMIQGKVDLEKGGWVWWARQTDSER